MKRFFTLAVVFFLSLITTSFAYEVADIKGSGNIKGKIKASARPEDPMLKIDTDMGFCRKAHPALMYILSPILEVKNALVIVEDVKKGKTVPISDITIDNKDCRFEPLVGIAFRGRNFVIKNSDPMFHNVKLSVILQDKRMTVYNLNFPKKDQFMTMPIKVTGLHQIKCDAHSWMRSYIYVSEHPYVAITDSSGNFEIKDLPPGRYKVKIWHEGFDEVTKDVEVLSGKTSELSLTLTKLK